MGKFSSVLLLLLTQLALVLAAYIVFLHSKNGQNGQEREQEQEQKRLEKLELEHQWGGPSEQAIYALMITGKDDKRIKFAKKAVENFMKQDYANKKLVILNHHPDPRMKVLDTNGDQKQDRNRNERQNCLEICMEKESLGHLRNASLEFVPMNACWTIWDDDDWRPHDYLSSLYKVMVDNEADCVAYTTRYEHNSNTKFSWKMTSMKGYPTVLCKKNPLIRYKNVDTMEDVQLLWSIREIGMKLFIYHNVDRPDLYIRLVHGNNSSLYINHQKTTVRPRSSESYSYKEDDISQKEKDFVKRTISTLMD